VDLSPAPSNIIWDTYGQKKPFDSLIDFLLNTLLFFLTIIFSTPITNAKMINSGLADIVGEDSAAYQFFFKMVGPIAMAIFNSFFIPMLVFWISEYLFFEKKTSRV